MSRSTTRSVRTPREPLTSTRSPGRVRAAVNAAASALLPIQATEFAGIPASTAASASARAGGPPTVTSMSRPAAAAAALRPAHSRGELLRLPGGLTLIDDSYNSSPAALKRSLETVAAARGSARKIAVLGEMLELGDHAARLHAECGAAAAATGLELLIAVGGDGAKALAFAATNAGMDTAHVVYVPTSAQAADVAVSKVRPGDLVLVKGSRGVKTDRVVDRLKAERG